MSCNVSVVVELHVKMVVVVVNFFVYEKNWSECVWSNDNGHKCNDDDDDDTGNIPTHDRNQAGHYFLLFPVVILLSATDLWSIASESKYVLKHSFTLKFLIKN